MAKAKKHAAAPKECRECPNWPKVSEKVRVSEVLRSMIGKMEKEIKANTFKPTIGDYLKLVQFEKELQQDEVKEIRVRWVEPGNEDSSTET
jgi:hypothetical protein